MEPSRPAIEGWFTTKDKPHLWGRQCTECAAVTFPPINPRCPNPSCAGEKSKLVPLSRRGVVWSYTDAQYRPPPPYLSRTELYRPFALAAVELSEEKIVILGQVADGYGTGDLSVGTTVELVVEPIYEIDGVQHLIYRWKPTS